MVQKRERPFHRSEHSERVESSRYEERQQDFQQRQQWVKIFNTRILVKSIKSYHITDDWSYRPCLYIDTFQRDHFSFESDSDSERDYIIEKFKELDRLFNVN